MLECLGLVQPVTGEILSMSTELQAQWLAMVQSQYAIQRLPEWNKDKRQRRTDLDYQRCYLHLNFEILFFFMEIWPVQSHMDIELEPAIK